MTMLLRLIPLIIGAALALWLTTNSAHAMVDATLGGETPDSIVTKIQTWGAIITVALTVVGLVASRAIAGFWAMRKSWDEHSREFEEEKNKRRAISQIQTTHDQQIKEVNAALPAPVPTIQPPVNPTP